MQLHGHLSVGSLVGIRKISVKNANNHLFSLAFARRQSGGRKRLGMHAAILQSATAFNACGPHQQGPNHDIPYSWPSGPGMMVKALVWFWWIEETQNANLVYQSDHEIGSTFQVMEQVVKIMMMVWPWWWSIARLGKEEREKQKAQGKGETW